MVPGAREDLAKDKSWLRGQTQRRVVSGLLGDQLPSIGTEVTDEFFDIGRASNNSTTTSIVTM